ncbi:MAG: dihydrolipoyl dehydrogenase [Nitrososphaeraceae archaeon]|nr:dihydrolipoyl dehydrogenase [Nitrososphaeraceae archaeon]
MYDIVVIGGGPGGYACAIRAAQLGGNVCLIEKNGLGGTCTQRGCIPTKYLHSLGDIMRRATGAKKNGLNIQIELNYKLLKSRMEATVSRLASGIKLLLKSNNVNLLEGQAHIVSENKVAVNDIMIETKNIVIATGSYPICLSGYEFGDNILSTTSILELEDLPKSITIIGGGYSGCEFASILNALGCKVSLIEAENHLLPFQIQGIGNAIEKYMRLDGVNVMTQSRVEKISDSIAFVNGEKIVAEKILICVGRRPNISPNELNNIGIKFNQQGIYVDEKMQTNIHNVYAIGDVTGMYELAHVENIMGIKENNKIDYQSLPVCVFTYPEVAYVGDLKGMSGEFPLAASAKANCLGDTRGLIKVFEKEGKLVGTYIIAPHAGEIIGEAALAIKMKLSLKTLPESFAEAVRDINNQAIHLPSKKDQIRKFVHPY